MASIIEEKSFMFAIKIVNLYKHLNETNSFLFSILIFNF